MQQKKIEGFSAYEITDDGRVWSTYTKKFLALKWDKKTKDRYYYISIRPDGANIYDKPKKKYIHRMVAEAFIPNTDKSKKHVGHKNNDKHDNRAENLEWVTPSENVKKAFADGLNPGTTGFKFSEESKKKKSESMKKAWANKPKEEVDAFREKCRQRMLKKKGD